MLLTLYEDVRLVFVAPDIEAADVRRPGQRLLDGNVRIYEFEMFDDELDGRPVSSSSTPST